MIKRAFGPPGTGKTTWIVSETSRLIRTGSVSPNKIYSVSLTKSTKFALIEKLMSIGIRINPENIRTLHSFCYRLLSEGNRKPYILSGKDLKGFFEERLGFEFKTEEPSEEEEFPAEISETEGNKLYQLFNKLRLTWDGAKPIEEYIKELYDAEQHEMSVSMKTFIELYHRYIRFLEEENVYDFTRLLTETNKKRKELSGDLLILDEYQDKGTLHHLIISRWVKNFKHVLVCGDDDQAIFTFAGSDPEYLIRFPAHKTYVLPESYRLPKKIHELATTIITQNRKRVAKRFEPKGEEGQVGWLHKGEVIDNLRESKKTLLLCRTKHFVEEWAQILESEDVPYRVLGRAYSIPRIARYLRAYVRLLSGKPFPPEELTGFALELKPLIRQITKKQRVSQQAIWGLSDKLLKKDFSGDLGKVAYLVYTRPIEELLREHNQRTLQKWLRRAEDYERWANPQLAVGTIHTAKGLEADRVFLDTRITKRVMRTAHRDPEAERRVLYVGVTRAREKLFLVFGNGYSYEHLGML